MTIQHSFEVANLAETETLGRRLGALLFPGAVVALIGTLGAGKTHLVRAIAEGLGLDTPSVVNSPTFVLIQEYDARLPIYHFDAYRLKTQAEFSDLGCQEYFHSDGVCLIEWADRVMDCLPGDHLRIEIAVTGAESRRIVLQGSSRYANVVERCVVTPN